MPDNRRDVVVQRILTERISAIIRTDDRALAADAMRAAVAGGFRMVEFTLTTPDALGLIREFAADDSLLVGAGTVLSVEQARQAVEAGAQFLVSPIIDPVIIAQAGVLDVACIPGAYTPTEMQTAYLAGANFVKVFPEPVGGAGFITAIRGPLPHLRLFPTAGVTSENVVDFLAAGCAGCGFVRSLFEPADLRAGNFDAIRARATGIFERVRAWKSQQSVAS